jgi:hypothetical protein
VVSGVPAPWTMPGAPGAPPQFAAGAAVRAQRGQKVLIRLLHAAYAVGRYTFELPVEVIGIDGRTLGHGDFMQYSQPFTVPANTPWTMSVARRWDLFIDTARIPAGTYKAKVEFFHSVGEAKAGELETAIIINP